MIKRIFFLIIPMGCMFSCNNDDDSINLPLEDHLVIGNPSAVTELNLEIPYILNHTRTHQIDLDNDGIDDYEFYVDTDNSGLNFHHFGIGLKSLHSEALFVRNDSLISPEILNHNDTISSSENTMENSTGLSYARLYLYNSASTPLGNTITEYGNWLDVNNKYIGLILLKNTYNIYGWVEVSIDDNGLKIHNNGFQACSN